jgi:predicted secreted protein
MPLQNKPFASRVARPWALAMALSGLAVAAQAQSQAVPQRNVVSLSATASQDINQDLLAVTLNVTREGSQAAEVQGQLKQVLEAALAEARKSAVPQGMDVRTGAFSMYPRYNNQGRVNGWQGSAQLVLEGTDMARIAQVAGKLTAVNVMGVEYGLSRATRESSESALLAQAVARYRAKAQDVAKAFGMGSFALGEVSVQSGEPGFESRPVPMLKAMRADAVDAAPLPVAPGKGTVSVTVSGSVILQP